MAQGVSSGIGWKKGKPAKRATEAERSFARYAGSMALEVYPGFRKRRFTLGHILAPAPLAVRGDYFLLRTLPACGGYGPGRAAIISSAKDQPASTSASQFKPKYT